MRTFGFIVLTLGILASATACTFSPPDVIFPRSGVLVYTENDLSDKAQGTLSLAGLDTANYHYYILAQTNNRGVLKPSANTEVFNGDNLVEIYRTIDELLYGTTAGTHMGSSTYADIESSTDGDYQVQNSASESYEVILGAASKCAIGRVNDGTVSDVFIRGSYKSTVTMTYFFTHGIDASSFSDALNSLTDVTNDPVMLVQHQDQALVSDTATATQTVERQDIVISSSLTPSGLGTNNECLDFVNGVATATSSTQNSDGTSSSTTFNGGACGFTAEVKILASTENGTDAGGDHEDHTYLLRDMSVNYKMSQYAQQNVSISTVHASSAPGDFDVTAEGVADGNDQRFDICEANICGPATGVSQAYCVEVENAIAIASDIQLQQNNVSTDAEVSGECAFKVFAMDHTSLANPSNSPYAYVRAWFSWDDGQVLNNNPDTTTATSVNEPVRRLLRSAKLAVQTAHKPLVQHTFRFKVTK